MIFNRIDRYIAKTILGMIALVLLLLFSLQLFILFVDEMRHLGATRLSVWQAFLHVLLIIPYRVYLFFPVASLLGCLLALGMMAGHSELIVMRAAGYSIGQITRAVLKTALILVILVTIIGESVLPRLMFYAENRKSFISTGGQTLRIAHGLWMRDRDSFIHITRAPNHEQLDGVLQYQFDKQHQLTRIRYAKQARFTDSQWYLYEVQTTDIAANQLKHSQAAEMVWQTTLNPRMLSVATIDADEMTLDQLHRFINEQKDNHLQVARYELNYWKRLFQPLATCVMMLLAIPFIFGPLRSATMGSRFLVGVGFGFGFHILNQFFIPVSAVYQVPPLLAALGPTLVFASIALLMIRRVR